LRRWRSPARRRRRAVTLEEHDPPLVLAADQNHQLVRIVFPHPLDVLGLDADYARYLAELLIEKADELDARKA